MDTSTSHKPSCEYLPELQHLVAKWSSDNTESVGSLWFNMLRFYTVEWVTSQHVVSITQFGVMERGKEWFGNRLAVERKSLNCTQQSVTYVHSYT